MHSRPFPTANKVYFEKIDQFQILYVKMQQYLQTVFQTAISHLLTDNYKCGLEGLDVKSQKMLFDAIISLGKSKGSAQPSDFQYNGLMRVVAFLKKSKVNCKPEEIWEQLEKIVKEYDDEKVISRTELNGVFVNIFITTQSITQSFWKIANQSLEEVFVHSNSNGKAHGEKLGEKQKLSEKIIVDYSSPNVAKSLHIGHLRSTIIGESLVRLLRLAGHKVEGINHIGDWGTPFGMLLHYFKTKYEYYGNEFDWESNNLICYHIEQLTPDKLTDIYREAKQQFDSSPEFAEKSRLEVSKLQQGDEFNRRVWKLLCNISRKDYEQIYKSLHVVNLTERGESYYQELIPNVISLLEQAGLVKESDGAKIIEMEGWTYPLIVVKRDSSYTYDTTDIAALYHRLVVEKADRVIYITDQGQRTHFEMCFQVAVKMGWAQSRSALQHIGFGLVLGADGKKLKTRSGDIVKLTDVMDELNQYAEQTLKERMTSEADSGYKIASQEWNDYYKTLSVEQLEEIRERIAMNTLKYYDLKHSYESSYRYNPEAMFQFNGDTGVYLMYVYARINGIIEKSRFNGQTDRLLKERADLVVYHQEPTRDERNLMLHVSCLPAVLSRAEQTVTVNQIVEYVFRLATLFNSFNTQPNGKIIGSELEEYRVSICAAVSGLLRQLFEIINLQEVEHI